MGPNPSTTSSFTLEMVFQHLQCTTGQKKSHCRLPLSHKRSRPDPTRDGPRLLAKLTAQDDTEAYVGTIGRTATREGHSQSGPTLAPFLSRETYYTLSKEDAANCATQHKEILTHCSFSSHRTHDSHRKLMSLGTCVMYQLCRLTLEGKEKNDP